jgi:hypothetical protein
VTIPAVFPGVGGQLNMTPSMESGGWVVHMSTTQHRRSISPSTPQSFGLSMFCSRTGVPSGRVRGTIPSSTGYNLYTGPAELRDCSTGPYCGVSRMTHAPGTTSVWAVTHRRARVRGGPRSRRRNRQHKRVSHLTPKRRQFLRLLKFHSTAPGEFGRRRLKLGDCARVTWY